MNSGEYPSEHEFVLEDGQRIHLYAAGNPAGEVVVLLHGGNIDHALLSWGHIIPRLAEAGYRVYAPEAPGYGKSPAPGQPFTLERATGYLHQVLDTLNVTTCTLGGISMGGGMALGYTLAHPERVRRLVLVGAYGLQDRAPFHLLSAALVQVRGMNAFSRRTLLGNRNLLRRGLKAILHNDAALTDDLLDQVADALSHSHSLEVWSQFQRDELRWGGVKTCFMPRLSDIQCPVLIVHGTHDIGVPLRYAQEAARRLPNARLEVFENAGHWTQRDQPEPFMEVLLAFMGAQRIDA